MSSVHISDEITASVKLSLTADSGYAANTEYRISANQWGDIIRVCEGTLKSKTEECNDE